MIFVLYLFIMWSSFFAVAAAVSSINDAIDKEDADALLAVLQAPSAKLQDVDPAQKVHYLTVLGAAKKNKGEVKERARGCCSVFFLKNS